MENLPQPRQSSIKPPPHDFDLEEAVIGSLMLDYKALVEVIDLLQVETFYDQFHQEVFTCIIELFKEGVSADILVVYNKYRKLFPDVNCLLRLSKMTHRVASSAGIEYKARILAEFAIRRKLILESQKIIAQAYELPNDIFDVIADHEDTLSKTINYYTKSSLKGIAELTKQAIDEMENPTTSKNGITGVASGLIEVDRITSGWQKTDLIIIAARPAMGKTAFVLSMMINSAVRFSKPVAMFSLEMSNIQLVKRMIGTQCEVNTRSIFEGNLSKGELQKIHSNVIALANAKIFIDDTSSLSLLELKTKATRLKKTEDIQMIIIDYLQLMTTGRLNTGNREQEISVISRTLKEIAKELNIPVIALSQLSRAVEARGDKKPMLSDLRESGSIEQDADIVSFIYRPEYYGLLTDENGQSTIGEAQLIIGKHRNGSTGTATMKFIPQYAKFSNITETYDMNDIQPNNDFEDIAPKGANDVPF